MSAAHTIGVAESLGVRYATLRRLVDRGVLTPTVVGHGSGNRSRWSAEDIARAHVVITALDEIAHTHGPRRTATGAAIWDALAYYGPPDSWPEFLFVVGDADTRIALEALPVKYLRDEAEAVLVVHVANILARHPVTT